MKPAALGLLRPVIGTLAHNRQFTWTDFEEYCYWRQPQLKVSRSTLTSLVKRGLLEQSKTWGRVYFNPTSAGWTWIETGELPAPPEQQVDDLRKAVALLADAFPTRMREKSDD